jgi:outer membrane lipoprotein-sorting protein
MRINVWLVMGASLIAAAAANGITADELIAKNIEARGGMDKIHAIHSLRETGKLRFGGSSTEMGFTNLLKKPGMLRQEFAYQGLVSITSYDGTEGWQIRPFRGRKDPEKLDADDVKTTQTEADLEGPLVDYKSKGHSVEYQGTEDVDGTEAHKLRVTLKNGDVRYIYLDPDYFLEIRYRDRTTIRGVQEEYETDLGNYEKVNGVYFPFSLETGRPGEEKSQKIEIEKAEANVDIPDTVFHFPTGGAK